MTLRHRLAQAPAEPPPPERRGTATRGTATRGTATRGTATRGTATRGTATPVPRPADTLFRKTREKGIPGIPFSLVVA
ncbi:hypothetical protein GCM10017608_01100 [Agromyces luteolus]|nr:hypothetical protein GCM10017608_01100 [Agromyces luteolus]